MNLYEKIIQSWSCKEGINTTKSLLDWVDEKNKSLQVMIEKTEFDHCKGWFFNAETGCVEHVNRGFFSIAGVQEKENGITVSEQPIILQNEIGYLGIICKEIDGIIHLLMQAKIEPGNVNKIQLSPTIQATKSNFTRVHGGKAPAYLDYFVNYKKYEVIVDQIQSEQSSRFLGKRNRNTVILVDEDVEVLPSHQWMTLGQIKDLMKIDNLVNMDTRTVLSCLPVACYDADPNVVAPYFKDPGFFKSIYNTDPCHPAVRRIYSYINDYKMFSSKERQIVRLDVLQGWSIQPDEIVSKTPHNYKVVYCNISIEGREVRTWAQPLFEATGIAVFGLLTCYKDGKQLFLVKASPEIGSFDRIELGPTVQLEAVEAHESSIDRLFKEIITDQSKLRYDVILSEEGGRFYHEQNRNVIAEVDYDSIEVPEGYFWVDFKTLNYLCQCNNVLNIQLRNLLSLLEVS